MVNKEMKFLDNGDIRYEIVDEAARNNIQTINTVLDTKADTSNVTALDTRVTGVEEDRYKPYVTDSASGAVTSFTDGADDLPLKSLVVNIDPVQDLHGYDSPWVAGGGENLLPKASTSNMDLHGITVTIDDDGSIILNGTTTDVSYIKVPLENVIASGTACAYGWFNTTASDSTVQFSLRQQDSGISAGGWNTANAVNRTFTFTTGADAYYWQIQISNEATFNNYKVSPMLVVGDTAPSTYTPYENICPISGWTGCNLYKTGGNLICDTLPDDAFYGYWGTDSTSISSASSYKTYCTYVGKNAKLQYRKDVSESVPLYLAFTDEYVTSKDGVVLYDALNMANRNGTILNSGEHPYLLISVSIGLFNNGSFDDKGARLYFYNDEVLPFSPRRNIDKYSISWQSEVGTVYGGKLDVLSGVLTIDRYVEDLSQKTWTTRYTGGTHKTLSTSLSNSYSRVQGNQIISEKYVLDYVTGVSNLSNPDDKNVGLYWYNNSNSLTSSTIYAVVNVDTIPSGLVVYPLTTPMTIQLTPHEVNSLLGTNNVWADSGNTEVEYRADTKLYIERLTASDSADMIADSNIVNGQYFMVSNALYKATTNIANGGQIIVGTNCTKVSLATALNEINA